MRIPISIMDDVGLSSESDASAKYPRHGSQKQSIHILAIALTNAPQSTNHPPATIPYTIPKTSKPATAWPVTPHRTNVAKDELAHIISARIHGETWSERLPMHKRDRTEDP